MKIIEIKALDNGAHRNQEGNFTVIPEGWAVLPYEIETPNFPFGEVAVKEIDGVKTVTKWTASDIPEIGDEEASISEVEQLRADIDYLVWSIERLNALLEVGKLTKEEYDELTATRGDNDD